MNLVPPPPSSSSFSPPLFAFLLQAPLLGLFRGSFWVFLIKAWPVPSKCGDAIRRMAAVPCPSSQ
eukprot:743631-Pyramimonas_sp.AAC.1